MEVYPALSKAIEGFILWKSACGLSQNTINDYQNYLNLFARWSDDPDINLISTKTIESFFNYLQHEHKVHRGGFATEKSLAPKTISNVWITFSVFWKWVVENYRIPSPFIIPKIRAKVLPIMPLSSEEVDLLLKACEYAEERIPSNRQRYKAKRPTFKRDRAIILTLLDTGIRASELCGISMENVDLTIGRLFVTGKGNKSRYVYVGKRSKQAIWAYVSQRFPRGKPPVDEPLFVETTGLNRLRRNGLLHLLKSLAGRYGINDVHPHKFRHTFAVEFLRNGGNVFTLQQLLGHSSLDMVRRYVALAETDLEHEHQKASPADRWHL